MSEINAIPKEISAEYGRDYAFLRAEGLKYIEQLSHKLWTDYNIHDPGITILEMLCYAITDLGYRTAFPVEDLLASEKDNMANMHKQFLSAISALPSNPLSANDYRQLFVRIEGIRNAWILPSERHVVAKFTELTQEGIVESHYKKPGEEVDPKEAHEFRLQGLNNVLLDFDDSGLLSPEEKKKSQAVQETLIAKKKKEISNRVLEVYQRYRNLCEDIDTIAEVPQQGVVICGDIDIQPNADPEQVWAQIVFNIDQYLSPDVPFYSLQEMLEDGKQPDEIFNGPVFSFDDDYPYRTAGNPFYKKGFVQEEDLVNSELRKEVRLSDIIRIIMQTEGVKVVKEIAFGLCACDEVDMDKVRKSVAGNKWNLCITPGHKPVFCKSSSVLNMWKDVMPIMLRTEQAYSKLDDLRIERNASMQAKLTEDLPMPEGKFRDISNYRTFQNHFPETYGTGQTGLPESAGAARKSKAKQLKAYLLFFEQALANYFAQLSNVGALLSAKSDIKQSYFANVVNGLKGSSEIFTTPEKWQDEVQMLLKSNGLDNFVQRRNTFLDHLLARFAEHFNEYVFLMHRLYSGDSDRAVIRHKTDFLKDYNNMSTSRGSGFDYYNPLPAEMQEVNVPGMEKRISRLLGFNNYKRKLLANLAYKVEQTGTVTLPVNGSPKEVPVYAWSIQMNANTIFESVNKAFLTRTDAFEEMGLASLLGCEREYYQMVLSANKKKVSFTLHTTSGITGVPGDAIATHPTKYNVLEGETESGKFSLAEEAISGIIDYLLNDFKLEGMYVVEHLLLRPDFTTPNTGFNLFLPLCIESNGNYCRPLDPYSFRITVVLPGYSMRLRNKNFRQFAERLIRMETPAHVLPRICFVDEENMGKFEEAYNEWLTERTKSKDPLKQASDETLVKLIEVLEEIFTVYEQGRLSDCDDETPERNPVILGRSTLGSLEQGSEPEQPE
jgi:uncharacterized protein